MGKRLFDLVVGTALAILTLPVVLVLALLLALELRAWPFFVQERVGLRGRRFSMVKLRTLPPSTPSDIDKYTLREYAVPPLARRLRSLHLDELPQFWLVVAGQMSLTGPRPEMPQLVDQLPEYAAFVRQTVRPGCTGLWQVSVAAGGLIHENPEYDVAYVAERSFALDLWILWRTVLIVVAGRPRSVTLNSLPGGHQVARLSESG